MKAIFPILSLLLFATIPAHAQQRALYDNLPDPFDITTADYPVRPTSEDERFLAQPFFTDALGYVSQVTVALGRRGAGTGTIEFAIWDDLEGQPGQAVAPLGEIALDQIPAWDDGGSLIPLDHPPIKLQPDTPYHLVWDFARVPVTTHTDGFDFPVFESPAGTNGASDIWVSQPATPGEIDGEIVWIKLASFVAADYLYLMMGVTVSEITVTNTDDSGPGSLRQAVSDSKVNGIISFDQSLSGATIALGGEPLVIDKDLNIDASRLSDRITIDGETAHDVIVVSAGADVSLRFLTITGGSRGVTNSGTLEMARVVISGNSGGWAAGIDNSGMLSMDRCLVAENSGVVVGGIVNRGTLIAVDSTLANNPTIEFHFGSPTDMSNSGTFIVNRCTLVQRFRQDVMLASSGELVITESTIAGLVNNNSTSADPVATLTLTNSIVTASNRPIRNSGDSIVFTNGTNLISDLTGSGLTESPSIIVADPRLAPLGDYGGPTPTMPPLPGSPTIDAHDAPIEATTDQRGFPRLVGSAYDLGAVEYQGDTDFRRVFHLDNDGDGTPFGVEQALGTDPFTPDPQNPRNLTIPTITPGGHATLTFGLNPDAHPGTLWILERSTDLQTFTEILRHDGTTTTHAENITSTQTPNSLTATDEAPPANGAYYRFRAALPWGGPTGSAGGEPNVL